MALPGGQFTGDPFRNWPVTRVGNTRARPDGHAPTGVVATLPPIEGIGQFTWISRDGRVLETVGEPARQLGVELSPDGQQAATFRSGEIWTMNLARPVPTRQTPRPASDLVARRRRSPGAVSRARDRLIRSHDDRR